MADTMVQPNQGTQEEVQKQVQPGAGVAQSNAPLQQGTDNKPAGNPPPNMRETYSVMTTGEVVSVGIARRGAGRGVQVEPWVWMDKERRWSPAEQVYGQDTADELVEGMQRYERVLQKDPKKAAMLRQRSDNTVDGNPSKDKAKARAVKDVAENAAQPQVMEGDETPPDLLTSQPQVAS